MDGVSGASAIASLVILGGKLVVQVHTFVGKVKDAPTQLRSMHTDLQSTVVILGKIQTALEAPGNTGVFSLKHARDEFDFVIETLMELFKELSRLVTKYDKLDRNWWQKGKWASVGLEEALVLGKSLAVHKANLTLTLQLAQGDTLSSIDRGVGNAEDNLRILMSQIERLRLQDTGANDPRLNGWLESVAEYAGSTMAPEDAATIPQDWSPDTSTLNLADTTVTTAEETTFSRADEMSIREGEQLVRGLVKRVEEMEQGPHSKGLPIPYWSDNLHQTRILGSHIREIVNLAKGTIGSKTIPSNASERVEMFIRLMEKQLEESTIVLQGLRSRQTTVKNGAERTRHEDSIKRRTELMSSVRSCIAFAKGVLGSKLAAEEAKTFNTDEKETIVEKTKDVAATTAFSPAKVVPRKKELIKFKDATDRTFLFPLAACQTWKGMHELICQAFLHDESMGKLIREEKYHLVGPSGDIILPQIWESVIEPDWSVTMHTWPTKEPTEAPPSLGETLPSPSGKQPVLSAKPKANVETHDEVRKVKIYHKENVYVFNVLRDSSYRQLYHRIREKLDLPEGSDVVLSWRDPLNAGAQKSLANNRDLSNAFDMSTKLEVDVEDMYASWFPGEGLLLGARSSPSATGSQAAKSLEYPTGQQASQSSVLAYWNRAKNIIHSDGDAFPTSPRNLYAPISGDEPNPASSKSFYPSRPRRIGYTGMPDDRPISITTGGFVANTKAPVTSVYSLPPLVFACIQYLTRFTPTGWEYRPFSTHLFIERANNYPMGDSPEIKAVADLWQRFQRDCDISLFACLPGRHTAENQSRVGDLLVWHLHERWKPFLPAELGRMFASASSRVLQLGETPDDQLELLRKNVRPTNLTPEKYLLLSRLLKFLNVMASRASPLMAGTVIMAQAFHKILGVGEDFAEIMIRNCDSLFKPMTQAGDENQFSLEIHQPIRNYDPGRNMKSRPGRKSSPQAAFDPRRAYEGMSDPAQAVIEEAIACKETEDRNYAIHREALRPLSPCLPGFIPKYVTIRRTGYINEQPYFVLMVSSVKLGYSYMKTHDEEYFERLRCQKDFYELGQALLAKFPEESKKLEYIQTQATKEAGTRVVESARMSVLNGFLESLLKLPEHVQSSETVRDFLVGQWPADVGD